MPIDPHKVRHHFPALLRKEVYLDNPGGTQTVKNSLDRVLEYLIEYNANHEGVFATSRHSDEVIARSRAAMAEFLNAGRPEEIIFGQNMTTLAFHLSRNPRPGPSGRRPGLHRRRPLRAARAHRCSGHGL